MMRRLLIAVVIFLAGILLVPAPVPLQAEEEHEAMWYRQLPDKRVQCELCPFKCVLSESQTGQCGVRKNIGGKLYSLNYGKVVSANVDPVEKKPVFHFLPGTSIYSIATAGCNLHCKYCQNWTISQKRPDELRYRYMTPEDIVAEAKRYDCRSIAYTYSEPIVFYELAYETAKLARAQGLKNVMVTSGYINEEPLRQLCKVMDVIKVDFKAFDKDFYRNVVFGDLDTVLNTMKVIKEEGVWLEVVNLVVPTLNDSDDQIRGLCTWIKDNLGDDTPLHFSRFHPTYRLTNLPLTPVATLQRAYDIAKETGLKFVYIGNVARHPYESTYCPRCGRTLIRRAGYHILENNIENGACRFCKEPTPGIWE